MFECGIIILSLSLYLFFLFYHSLSVSLCLCFMSLYLSLPLSPLSLLFLLPQPQQHNGVRALHTCVVGNDPVLLTGGTDRFIRMWHLNNPTESSCVVKAGPGSEKIDISYK